MGINTNYVFTRKNYIDQVMAIPCLSALSDDATCYIFTGALGRPCPKPSECTAKAIWSSKTGLL